MLRAGFVSGQALAELRSNGTLPDALGMSVQQAVSGGQPLSEALARFPDEFPEEDVALIEAGEATGRLDRALDQLAELHDLKRRERQSLLVRSLYPIFLAHFAAFLLPIANLASKAKFTLASWLGEALTLLLPFWAIVLLVRYLSRFAVWRDRFRVVVDHIPGFGGAARHRRRAVFASVLEAAYEAGVPMDRSLNLASRASHEPRAVRAAADVAAGSSLTLALTGTGVLAPDALSRIASSEQAGEISKALHFIAEEESDRADNLFKVAMKATGVLLSLVVMGWIAYSVISFYANLYAPILK